LRVTEFSTEPRYFAIWCPLNTQNRKIHENLTAKISSGDKEEEKEKGRKKTINGGRYEQLRQTSKI